MQIQRQWCEVDREKKDFETIDRILKEQRKKGKVMQQNLNQRSLPSIGNINVILSHSVCFSLFWPQKGYLWPIPMSSHLAQARDVIRWWRPT